MNVPRPPDWIFDLDGGINQYVPDPAIADFVAAAFLDEKSELYNPDHGHLSDAKIGFLWTTAANKRHQKRIVGEAELPTYRVGQWIRGRLEYQLQKWFGPLPDFVVTFDANFRADVPDFEFMALLEHELYHCGQALDEFGSPRFNQNTGRPIFAIRGHDIEEFSGVVRRYGVEAAGFDRAEFVAAANRPAELDRVRVAQLCGTCSA